MKKSIIGILTIASIVFGCGKKPEPQTVAEQTPPPSAAKQTPSTADPRPQAKPAAKSAPTADVSKQTKAIGMMWPLAKQLANKDMLDSYVADVLQRAPNLPQIAADSDLRILANADNSPLPDSDMPVAYCLFEKDNFTNGTKISAKSLSQEIKAALTQGCKVAGNADPTVLADDREPSLFMPKCRDNKKTLEDSGSSGNRHKQ